MSLIEHDLIDSITKAPNPIVQCIMVFTATELCGSFLTGQTGQGSTRTNFLAFWKSQYMQSKYHVVSELLYDLLRNGVSHSFIPKGGIAVGADHNTAPLHLQYSTAGLVIYTPQLESDVVDAIRALLKDIKAGVGNLATNYHSVLATIVADGDSTYKRFLQQHGITPIPLNISGDIRSDI